jgi:hypothetical protein
MHTPGPWIAKQTPASAYFDWSVEAKSGPGRIMSIGVDTDNTEADAKLIAAAPDLLACLKDWVNDFADCLEGGDENELVKFSRAAIAKAQG